MAYVDGYVMPVPRRKLATYRRLARLAGKVWREYGALEYRECAGDDLGIKSGTNFRTLTRMKPGETVIFAWVVYKSKRHRDEVNRNVLADPRMQRVMGESAAFDMKRMAYGGFKMIVDL